MTEQKITAKPCRFCLRLTRAEICADCESHSRTFGHFPEEVLWQKPPGQPRMMLRICGRCGREV